MSKVRWSHFPAAGTQAWGRLFPEVRRARTCARSAAWPARGRCPVASSRGPIRDPRVGQM